MLDALAGVVRAPILAIQVVSETLSSVEFAEAVTDAWYMSKAFAGIAASYVWQLGGFAVRAALTARARLALAWQLTAVGCWVTRSMCLVACCQARRMCCCQARPAAGASVGASAAYANASALGKSYEDPALPPPPVPLTLLTGSRILRRGGCVPASGGSDGVVLGVPRRCQDAAITPALARRPCGTQPKVHATTGLA